MEHEETTNHNEHNLLPGAGGRFFVDSLCPSWFVVSMVLQYTIALNTGKPEKTLRKISLNTIFNKHGVSKKIPVLPCFGIASQKQKECES